MTDLHTFIEERKREFVGFYALPEGFVAGPERNKAIADFLEQSLLSLAEEFEKLVPEKSFRCGDCASANYCDCFDKNNEYATWRNETLSRFRAYRGEGISKEEGG